MSFETMKKAIELAVTENNSDLDEWEGYTEISENTEKLTVDCAMLFQDYIPEPRITSGKNGRMGFSWSGKEWSIYLTMKVEPEGNNFILSSVGKDWTTTGQWKVLPAWVVNMIRDANNTNGFNCG